MNRAANVQDSRKEVDMNMQKLTILYQRLSKDDINSAEAESKSIINQRDMLIKYAEQNNFIPYRCLSDDGKTGTNLIRVR